MYYSEITRKTVSYIESNLTEDINLNSFTSVIGYSKYHLSRLFKKDTGKSIVEYIRLRRLALAATLLLETEESILTIGFLFRFQSQEAFSRAFKEVYSLPPGKYRQLMRAVRIIKEENDLNNQEQINGWNLSGSYTELYDLTVDDKVFHTGTKSGLLFAKGEANEQQFGTMMQGFQAENYKNKRIKMSCFLKTEQVTKCGAWLRIDNVSGDTLQFDNMDSRSIHGTTDWNHYSIVLDVPEESASIYFGVLLVGKGKVWADGFRFEEVNEKVDSTNMLFQDNLPKQPLNLDFSE
ncbi:AraC-type DNA-binding protein [Psychrobacillus psychrotolerans]|uniref:AraC-type DNA-binding protein n=1 Tax=Psychrobacillus psychrotolerans TaxID=126156 RepID=A0A1I5VJT7_9BACI|nr:AraC family transcriptional regulator [Psychrobacillus psychrotolerans]SFQ07814.1 AraC-type DNA-binding protein [Psychrobacillus psychrotolerans]